MFKPYYQLFSKNSKNKNYIAINGSCAYHYDDAIQMFDNTIRFLHNNIGVALILISPSNPDNPNTPNHEVIIKANGKLKKE